MYHIPADRTPGLGTLIDPITTKSFLKLLLWGWEGYSINIVHGTIKKGTFNKN